MISVRPATIGDSDQIARAHIRTWQDGGSRLVPVGTDYPDAAPVEHVRYTLRDARRA